MKNVVIRALSGTVYVALVVACVLYSDISLLILCLFLCCGGMWEVLKLERESPAAHPIIRSLDIITGMLVVASGYIPALVPWLILYLPARLICELYTKSPVPAADLGKSFLTILYVACPLLMLYLLRVAAGAHLVLAMFILIWLSDTGAFCVGSLIGRHRLFERISPKKSWEGFFGGVVFCVIAAFVMKEYFPTYFSNVSMALMLTLGIAVPCFGTLGDLVESMLKRAAGVKDSGHIMPGHGGFLDRTDSLLVVTPVVYSLILLFQ